MLIGRGRLARSIPLPDGRTFTTLEDAGRYVPVLPKAEQKKAHQQTAAGELLTAAECGGIVMAAEIAMGKAPAFWRRTGAIAARSTTSQPYVGPGRQRPGPASLKSRQ